MLGGSVMAIEDTAVQNNTENQVNVETSDKKTKLKKKKILSCIQPSGIPTLGNYLGALKNWKNMLMLFRVIYL